MKKLSPRNEPIAASTLAVVIGWAVAKFALDMDTTTVNAVALVLFAAGQYVARNFSIPVRKHEKVLREVFAAKKPPV